MRIVTTTPVTFKGSLRSQFKKPAVFTIRKDCGECFTVEIPDEEPLIKAFYWLSDNDMLRYLVSLMPVWKTNYEEICEIEQQNDWLRENAYAYGKTIKRFDYGNLAEEVPGLQPVPDLTYVATWMFTCEKRAVMFKLACGGEV